MPDVDVVIVGAGLAGLSAAYKLAQNGINTLVIERGPYPGSKNVSGGRMYLHAIRRLIKDIPLEELPFERFVIRECITFVGDDSYVTLELNQFKVKQYMSGIVLRAKFDKWFASLVEEKGAMIVTNKRVNDLLFEKGKISGIIAEGDQITANAVIIAEGANSFLAEKYKLRKSFSPKSMTVAVKGIVELGEEEINKRFNLKSREGVAHAFVGITKGVQGGGFIYTNKDVVAIGVVCLLESLVKNKVSIADLFEYYRLHPAIQRYIEGGKLVEYSGHLTPELGINMMPKIVSDGLLIAGDAAAFFLEAGPILRGMDFAIESGSLAAETLLIAHKKGDFSEKTLNIYLDMLNNSFVLRDLRRYKNSPKFMNNQRLYTVYPRLINEIYKQIMHVDGSTKPLLGKLMLDLTFKKVNPIYLVKDMIEAMMYL
jgi:electron transfer flavoprotein-quinone oxidoreductase